MLKINLDDKNVNNINLLYRCLYISQTLTLSMKIIIHRKMAETIANTI